MMKMEETYSPSGVRIADDFRDNLIIDKYHSSFVAMRQSKKKHLQSENSEDALSWNVFRSLRQIHPEKWLPLLFQKAFGISVPGSADDTCIELWRKVPPPPTLLETGDEGMSETDIVLENPSWVWFIEAKYKSDISEGTTTRPGRDQVLRNIDVGSYYAGVRPFYFALLILERIRSPKGVEAIEKYKSLDTVKAALPHRVDGVSNVKGVGLLTWQFLADALITAQKSHNRPDEQIYAYKAIEWLKARGVAQTETSP